jgi:hypothetical protein
VSAVMTEHPDMSPMTEACTPVARPRDQTSPRRRLRANSGAFQKLAEHHADGKKGGAK